MDNNNMNQFNQTNQVNPTGGVNQFGLPNNVNQVPVQDPNKKNKFIIGICISLIVLVIIAVVVVFFLVNKDDTNTNSPSETTKEAETTKDKTTKEKTTKERTTRTTVERSTTTKTTELIIVDPEPVQPGLGNYVLKNGSTADHKCVMNVPKQGYMDYDSNIYISEKNGKKEIIVEVAMNVGSKYVEDSAQALRENEATKDLEIITEGDYVYTYSHELEEALESFDVDIILQSFAMQGYTCK